MTPSLKRALRLMLLTALPSLILLSCALQTPTPATSADTAAGVVTDTGCVAFARLTFDRLKDTDETIRQIKAYDAARDAVCGGGK